MSRAPSLAKIIAEHQGDVVAAITASFGNQVSRNKRGDVVSFAPYNSNYTIDDEALRI